MSKNIGNYPWLASVWLRLNQFDQRLPHAVLLHGRAGIGKFDFALNFSQGLLCLNKSANGQSCGTCASCHWFNENSHPDFRLLSPEQEPEVDGDPAPAKKTKKKTQISVAQVRALGDFLGFSSHTANGLRIVLIHPAESLNTASANALLKVLEEPASGVLFILVTHHLQRLLPTIISRCQKIHMPMPNKAQALAWLNAQGIQNAAQQLAYFDSSPIKVLSEQAQFALWTDVWRQLALGPKLEPHIAAGPLISNSVESGVIAVQKWIYDILAIKFGCAVRYHVMHTKALQGLADKVNLTRLLEFQKKVEVLRKLVTHPLNHDLQMESLLLEYTRMFQMK